MILLPSKKTDTDNMEDFWQIIEQLKLEPRRGWKEKLRLGKVESVADHSYGVAMLGLYQAWSRGGYDLERLLKLALVHDFDEAITGDLTPRVKRTLGRAVVLRRRRIAGQKIMSLLSEKARSEWIGLWTDLRRGQSKEARLVKDVDQLEMVLQAKAYSQRKASKASRRKVQEFYDSALRRIENPELRNVVERIAGQKEVKR
jgi:putative hydrolases of HD superfamily